MDHIMDKFGNASNVIPNFETICVNIEIKGIKQYFSIVL